MGGSTHETMEGKREEEGRGTHGGEMVYHSNNNNLRGVKIGKNIGL
jgi:hypothetical protein